MIQITLTDEMVMKAKKFSEKVVGTNKYYSKRGQSNPIFIQEQIFIGKLGEYGTREWLLQTNHLCSEVDVEITLDKSFRPDLLINNNIPCHVKSQSMISADRFGMSWTFQFAGDSGTGHRDTEIFDNYGENDEVVFCLVQPPIAKICAEIKVADLHRLKLFHFPKLAALHDFKRAVYYDDIPPLFRT